MDVLICIVLIVGFMSVVTELKKIKGEIANLDFTVNELILFLRNRLP